MIVISMALLIIGWIVVLSGFEFWIHIFVFGLGFAVCDGLYWFFIGDKMLKWSNEDHHEN